MILNAITYIALALAGLAQQSSNLEWNKKSILNADQRVEFPGIVLEPGVYVVRLREGDERRSVVEILNQDETQVLATVTAVPDHHVRPDDSDFTFHEVPGGGPRPVKSWFYGSDLVGLEFVYPKARAKEIARRCDDHVMASNGDDDGAIVAVTPNGKEVVIDAPLRRAAREKPQ
jgi:hypothetical protein